MVTSFLRKSVAGGLAALTVAGAMATASVPAQARDGGAIAAGVVGGLALGAIAGSAAANANRGGYYEGGYAPPPPVPVYGGCYFTRQPIYDEYGYPAGSRRVRVCE